MDDMDGWLVVCGANNSESQEISARRQTGEISLSFMMQLIFFLVIQQSKFKNCCVLLSTMFTNVCDFIPTVQKFRKVEEIVSETFTHCFHKFLNNEKNFFGKSYSIHTNLYNTSTFPTITTKSRISWQMLIWLDLVRKCQEMPEMPALYGITHHIHVPYVHHLI